MLKRNNSARSARGGNEPGATEDVSSSLTEAGALAFLSARPHTPDGRPKKLPRVGTPYPEPSRRSGPAVDPAEASSASSSALPPRPAGFSRAVSSSGGATSSPEDKRSSYPAKPSPRVLAPASPFAAPPLGESSDYPIDADDYAVGAAGSPDGDQKLQGSLLHEAELKKMASALFDVLAPRLGATSRRQMESMTTPIKELLNDKVKALNGRLNRIEQTIDASKSGGSHCMAPNIEDILGRKLETIGTDIMTKIEEEVDTNMKLLGDQIENQIGVVVSQKLKSLFDDLLPQIFETLNATLRSFHKSTVIRIEETLASRVKSLDARMSHREMGKCGKLDRISASVADGNRKLEWLGTNMAGHVGKLINSEVKKILEEGTARISQRVDNRQDAGMAKISKMVNDRLKCLHNDLITKAEMTAMKREGSVTLPRPQTLSTMANESRRIASGNAEEVLVDDQEDPSEINLEKGEQAERHATAEEQLEGVIKVLERIRDNEDLRSNARERIKEACNLLGRSVKDMILDPTRLIAFEEPEMGEAPIHVARKAGSVQRCADRLSSHGFSGGPGPEAAELAPGRSGAAFFVREDLAERAQSSGQEGRQEEQQRKTRAKAQPVSTGFHQAEHPTASAATGRSVSPNSPRETLVLLPPRPNLASRISSNRAYVPRSSTSRPSARSPTPEPARHQESSRLPIAGPSSSHHWTRQDDNRVSKDNRRDRHEYDEDWRRSDRWRPDWQRSNWGCH